MHTLPRMSSALVKFSRAYSQARFDPMLPSIMAQPAHSRDEDRYSANIVALCGPGIGPLAVQLRYMVHGHGVAVTYLDPVKVTLVSGPVLNPDDVGHFISTLQQGQSGTHPQAMLDNIRSALDEVVDMRAFLDGVSSDPLEVETVLFEGDLEVV